MAVGPAVKRRKLSPPETHQNGVANPTQPTANAPTQEDFYKRAAGWNLEQDYESRPRKQKKEKKGSTRLPIKTVEGKVEALEVADEVGTDDDWLSSNDDTADKPRPVSLTSEPARNSSASVSKRQQILDAKEELAKLASHINEDPEDNAGGFRALAQIAATPDPTIKKLALATQMTVFKDVIPGYRIRPMSESDQTEKVSKDVRRLRTFEQALVGAWQVYLKDLAACAKGSIKFDQGDKTGVSRVAISCACALLLAVPHFNFRGELLKILVGKLSQRKRDVDFEKCLQTMEEFFRNDDDGTPSLDAVGLLTRMMKARNHQIDESVLNTFLHLRLLSEFSSKGSQNRIDKQETEETVNGKKPKFKKEFRTKKQRKILKERKLVEKDFKEADAVVSHENRDRMQAETLKLVFVTYFRILKARVPGLMGAVLEGLAKYAHLINQDFFGDLLEALRDLVHDVETQHDVDDDEDEDEDDRRPMISSRRERNFTREALLCITTAFALLEGQDVAKSASSLSLDLSFFTAHLYKSLHAIAVNPDIELSAKSLRLPDPHASDQTSNSIPNLDTKTRVNVQTTTVLLLRALSSTLAPRDTPPVRLAAFTKQLYTSSLHLPERSLLAVLSQTGKVAKTHGRKIAALWNTEERKGDGIFDPLRADLEGSNPFASTIWEGEVLKLHFSPGVREGARGVEKTLAAIK